MGKDREPSIITVAKEHNGLLALQERSRERLIKLIGSVAERKLLDGERSLHVLEREVYGELDGTDFSVKIRGGTRDFLDRFALEFGAGNFYRTFVFDGSDCFVWEIHMDFNRGKGEWIGSPKNQVKRTPLTEDLTQLNEAMDLFEQNVGKGVNRD